MGHSDHTVRKSAATCLGRLLATEAVAALIDRLENDDKPDVRKEAAIALNQIKDRRAIRPLIGAIEDESHEVRRVAVIALGNVRMLFPEVVTALESALEDNQYTVREAACAALANLRSLKSYDKIRARIADPRDEVARQASLACYQLLVARERPEYDRPMEPV